MQAINNYERLADFSTRLPGSCAAGELILTRIEREKYGRHSHEGAERKKYPEAIKAPPLFTSARV